MTDGGDLKSQFFFREKIGVTQSVAAPSDANPSDATAHILKYSPVKMMFCFSINATLLPV